MGCDVVIYNVTQHADQVEEALWAVSALHNEIEQFSGPKVFILISTVMTWACSKPVDPDDPEVPFIDVIFWSRRAHPNFKLHIDLERSVVKMGKTKSWLGEDEIPVFGDGKNIVPTIHVHDLASVVYNVIEHQPSPYYLLAVDNSENTMEEIVKVCLASHQKVMEIDSILVNLRMEAVYIKKLFSFNWLCQFGLVENIELVVEEFRQTRGLLPIRLCVLGPPAVGKSTVSKKICEYYRLHHITVKGTISETITQLEHAVRNPDPDEENSTREAQAQDQLSAMRESVEQNRGMDRLLDVSVMKDKLMTNPCKNQGYVLEDFPQTYAQAKDNGSLVWATEFVLCLDASEAFLVDRVLNLSERLVQQHNYEPDNFLRRLASYKDKQTADETVINYFYELDIIPLNDEVNCLPLMQKVFDTVGQPRNYGPSSEEVMKEERRKADERLRREAQHRAEEKRVEAEEARDRAAHWDEWQRGGNFGENDKNKKHSLEAQSGPMRNYLMEHIIPTLSQGLIECCRAQPQDPVDFLAEHLLKNSPF
uniref:Adenylate kinase 7b n=1 Tax=Amphilophus citrinellus TaxID=61819 RepID=A0A3Q0RZS9_AMPCI